MGHSRFIHEEFERFLSMWLINNDSYQWNHKQKQYLFSINVVQ